MNDMTTRRAVALALMALDDVARRYPGDPDWRGARYVLSHLRKVEEAVDQQLPAPRTTTEAVYQFIVRYKREHDGLSPTMREIVDSVGLGSTSVAAYQLRRLEKRGLIRRRGNRKFGLMVIGGEWQPPNGR